MANASIHCWSDTAVALRVREASLLVADIFAFGEMALARATDLGETTRPLEETTFGRWLPGFEIAFGFVPLLFGLPLVVVMGAFSCASKTVLLCKRRSIATAPFCRINM